MGETRQVDFCEACKQANAQQLYCGKDRCDPKAVVIIQVSGGIAEVVKQPGNINVQIVDYDNEE